MLLRIFNARHVNVRKCITKQQITVGNIPNHQAIISKALQRYCRVFYKLKYHVPDLDMSIDSTFTHTLSLRVYCKTEFVCFPLTQPPVALLYVITSIHFVYRVTIRMEVYRIPGRITVHRIISRITVHTAPNYTQFFISAPL